MSAWPRTASKSSAPKSIKWFPSAPAAGLLADAKTGTRPGWPVVTGARPLATKIAAAALQESVGDDG